MKRAGVIGHPLGHSVSPAIFEAAFRATGIDATYEAWDTPPDALRGRVDALRGDDFFGANVTVPYKETVVPMLDTLDEVAARIGAVNTIVQDGGALRGHNTDVSGFRRALEETGFDPRGKRAAILGAGGAARAVAAVLVDLGMQTVFVSSRNWRRADALVSALRPATASGTQITWSHWEDGAFIRAVASADLVVNATPAGTARSELEGQAPTDTTLIRAGALAFDLVYNPPETPFLAGARRQGARPVGGLSMLVYQAAEAFRLWTGREAPVDAMLSAAREALGLAPAGT
jgi:shikimate dehydrogenase